MIVFEKVYHLQASSSSLSLLCQSQLSFSSVPSSSLNEVIICWKIEITDFSHHLPKNVEQMYSEIWLPDLLDSLKCDNSLFSIRLNCKNDIQKIEIVSVSLLIQLDFMRCELRRRCNNLVHTLSDAMSETLRCVWIVSNWSKHQSNSSIVSIAKRTYCSSPGTIGLFNGVAADLFDLFVATKMRVKRK